jgi:hypothetical protein
MSDVPTIPEPTNDEKSWSLTEEWHRVSTMPSGGGGASWNYVRGLIRLLAAQLRRAEAAEAELKRSNMNPDCGMGIGDKPCCGGCVWCRKESAEADAVKYRRLLYDLSEAIRPDIDVAERGLCTVEEATAVHVRLQAATADLQLRDELLAAERAKVEKAVAEERERCAKIASRYCLGILSPDNAERRAALAIAAAIRQSVR